MVQVGGGKDARGRGRRRRKVSYLTINKIYTLDYKDVGLLKRFVNDQGKIVPARQSGATAKEQRMISTAIRRAREMALLPFVALDTSANERRPMTERRSYRSREHREDSGPSERPAERPAAPPAAEASEE